MAEGRRERMRDKIRVRGIEGMAPHEIVEFLLYPFVPRKDTSPLARTLLFEFGGLDNLLNAKEEELLTIPSMPKMAAITFPLYKSIVESANALNERNRTRSANDYSQLANYCVRLLKNCYNERLIAIYVNDNEKIIGQKVIADGTSSRLDMDFNKIAKGAILLDAKSVALAHNHPNGVKEASTDDLYLTEKLKAHLSNLGIRLLDHLIVCGEEVVSIYRLPKEEI